MIEISKKYILVYLLISLYFLPEYAIKIAGNKGYLIIILTATMIFMMNIVWLWINRNVNVNKVSKRLRLCGKVYFSLKYIVLAAFLSVNTARLVKLEILGEIDYRITLFMSIAVGIYCGLSSKAARNRLGNTLFYIIFVPFVILLAFSIKDILTPENIYFHAYENEVVFTDAKRLISASVFCGYCFSNIGLLVGEEVEKLYKESGEIIVKVVKKVGLNIVAIMAFDLMFYYIILQKITIGVVRAEGNSLVKLMNRASTGGYIGNKQSGIYICFLVMNFIYAIGVLMGEIFSNICGKDAAKKEKMCISSIYLFLIIFLAANYYFLRQEDFCSMKNYKIKYTRIEDRRYVDSIFIEEYQGEYKLFLTFADSNKAQEIQVKQMKDFYKESEKIISGQIDFSNLLVIGVNINTANNTEKMGEIFDFLCEEHDINDNAYFLEIYNGITDFSDKYEENGDDIPGKKIAFLIDKCSVTKNKNKSLLDLKKFMYSEEKCEIFPLFSFEEGEFRVYGSTRLCRRFN